jgi:CubicO group peptidase (beta-lactamase class C family)
MSDIGLILINLFLVIDSTCCIRARVEETGINNCDSAFTIKIDNLVAPLISEIEYLNIALVKQNKIVLTKSYGTPNINLQSAYCSISKPVTSAIVIQLLNQGKIKSLDDDIRNYSPKYKDCLPDQYKNSIFSFKTLLTHTSGVKFGGSKSGPSIWKDGKLDLLFAPGESFNYSTGGYAIIGEIIESITKMSYDSLVKEYIGKPIGAESFNAKHDFLAPGALVYSTIKDMALFSIGIMQYKYFSENVLYDIILPDNYSDYGLGWYYSNKRTKDFTISHPGNNGMPISYITIKPKIGLSVCILARKKNKDANISLAALSDTLIRLLEKE